MLLQPPCYEDTLQRKTLSEQNLLSPNGNLLTLKVLKNYSNRDLRSSSKEMSLEISITVYLVTISFLRGIILKKKRKII